MEAETVKPIYQTISYDLAREFADKKLGLFKNIVYLHSAQIDENLARYSFIALDPFRLFIAKIEDKDNTRLLDRLDACLQRFKLQTIKDLPPFQGGIAGFLSYDLAETFEKLPSMTSSHQPIPKISVCAYDLVISLDHFAQKAWVVSSGFPEYQEEKRLKRAKMRLDRVLTEISQIPSHSEPSDSSLQPNAIQSNFTAKSYLKTVEKVMEYIRNGDIFQANLSQQFSCPMPEGLSDFQLFQRLERYNAAPFSAFVNIGEASIISSSPERFIRIEKDCIETRPVKGTIRRSLIPFEDQLLREKLLNSEKDRAENAMIVDLMRNDLAKICEPGSVKVEKFCNLESFETLHHLVSVIRGKLLKKIGLKALLKAVFPGGSITGAPKIRAMEIIEELEPHPRGPYCGSVFYYGFNGTFDSSILIRTFVLFQNTLQFQAGGGIVLDSNPQLEYEETLVKAAALIKTLTGNKVCDDFTH